MAEGATAWDRSDQHLESTILPANVLAGRPGRPVGISQEWKDNMVHASTPKIKEKVKKGLGTTVSFLPDYERFGVTDEEWPFLESLLRRRLYDIAATTPLRVTFNGDRIDLSKIAGVKRMKNFAAYALLLGPSAEENPDIVHASLGERWECVVMMRPPGIDDQDPPSFVNGIRTDLGGGICGRRVPAPLSETGQACQRQRSSALRGETICLRFG